MTTLEQVKNAEKAWDEACRNKWAIWDKMIADAEAEGRTYQGEYGSTEHTFTDAEMVRLIEANNEIVRTYQEWNGLKNKRARELRQARA